MAKSAREIYDEILEHVRKEGGAFSTWYSGITSDIAKRVHGDHKVPMQNHWLITRRAASANDARAIEEALLKLGFDGGPGGGDNTSDCVYCYKKTSITEP